MIHLYLFDYYNLFKTSGLTTYLQNLSSGLLGNEKLLLHFVWVKSFQKNMDFAAEPGEKDIEHIYLPQDIAVLNEQSGFDVKAADYLQSLLQGKEKIILHFNWINHCAFARLMKKRINCKTLLTRHCIPWRDYVTSNYPLFFELNQLFQSNKATKKIHPALQSESLLYEDIDHIICVTQCAKKDLINLMGCPKDKISVIYNGFDHHLLTSSKKSKSALRKKYGFGIREKIILFSGTIDERKGAYFLAELFETFMAKSSCKENMRLIFAGGGNHSQLLSNIQNFWAKITITGNLEKERLYDFYALADLGIVPSYIEQCSYSAIEMMHSGLPIIVTDIDGLQEIVPTDAGCKIPVHYSKNNKAINKDCACSFINHFLFEDPQQAECSAKKAKQYAIENFSARKMIAETLSVYENFFREKKEQKIITAPYNTDGPLVSVVLPCYNAATYLKDCIESIINQSYENIEIIIINDASTDNTKTVINRYKKDTRIHVIENKENKGVNLTLNAAVSGINGKYTVRIDADDIMNVDRIMKQVAFLEMNTDFGMVGSCTKIIDPQDRVINKAEYPLEDYNIRMAMFFGNPFCHPAVTIRSSVLKSIGGYPTDFDFCEDYALWFKIAAKNKVANLEEMLTEYRIHANSISNKNSKKQRENSIELIADTLAEIGIAYSVEELSLHAAICFGYKKAYFNNKEKTGRLQNWLDKLFSSSYFKDIPKEEVAKFKAYIQDLNCIKISLPFL